jgi:iron complex transport system ATP-binding protein
MTGADLEVRDLCVVRSGKEILHVDQLRIESGQMVHLIGANGAGKTTLIKSLCGLLKPTRGTVWFNRADLYGLNGWQRCRLRQRIGYIPQSAEYNADLPFTVREVVVMGRASVRPLLRGLTGLDFERVDEWIERLGLKDRRDQTFRSLSGGEQQKALIARAMAQEPNLLMLDEPTSNLDFRWKRKITDLVHKLRDLMKLTVLMISHEISSVGLYSDRTLLLDHGRIVADGPAEQVFSSEAMERVYQCRIHWIQREGQRVMAYENLDGP